MSQTFHLLPLGQLAFTPAPRPTQKAEPPHIACTPLAESSRHGVITTMTVGVSGVCKSEPERIVVNSKTLHVCDICQHSIALSYNG